MKFKIDENLPTEVRDLFNHAGHEAATVVDEGLSGDSDRNIADVCKSEGRVLLTLNTDFGNIRAYPPRDFQGMIVIRTDDQSKTTLLEFIPRIISALRKEVIYHTLWIVEKTRIRIRSGESEG